LAQRIPGVEASTIHSLCYRRLELAPYQVVSREYLENFSKRTGIAFADSRGEDALTAGDEYLSLLSLARNTFRQPSEVANLVHLGTASEYQWFCETYPRWKAENHLTDFDDMLHRIDRSDLKGNWGSLVVDEAQDLNPAQWRIVHRLIQANDFQNVWVAGDDDQAIYTWAGATPEKMESFGDYVGAKTEILTQSYRIPAYVHSKAERVLGRIRKRKTKTYEPRASRGVFKIEMRLDNASNYDVILYRNHSIGRQVATELSILGFPFKGRRLNSAWDSNWGQLVRTYQRLLDGDTLTGKQLKKIEKASHKDACDLVARGRSWDLVFPTLPVHVRSNLHLIEARFGPLHKVKPIELTTIHQYKGKEADSVLLVDGMNERTKEGFAKDPDSEYRVFYVGVTRARQKLGIYEHDNPLGIGRLK
jgi:superfamily I DNA/RNA helicase